MSDKNLIHATSENFVDTIVKSTEPVVLDFWAPWCGPCLMIGPILSELADKYAGKVKVAKIDVDQEPELAGQFRIRGIPTLVVFHGGEVVHHQVGFAGRGPLEELFEKLAQPEAKN